jgi:hypothetical protein
VFFYYFERFLAEYKCQVCYRHGEGREGVERRTSSGAFLPRAWPQ